MTKFFLALTLIRREIDMRYRGSALGLLWSLLTPLLMLAVYTFLFGIVLRVRWSHDAGAEHSTAEFAIILFAGLTVFQLFSEVVNRAPTLILTNVNYVKKVVFPLEVLPVVALGAAAFHVAVSFAVLLAFIAAFMGVPWTAILLPLVVAPFFLLLLGLSWCLAALGVFVRDIGQILGPAVTAMMFLSPIFIPPSALPETIRPWIALNPIAVPVDQVRNVLIFGRMPDWPALALYALVALAIAVLGYLFFQKTRKGFADVL